MLMSKALKQKMKITTINLNKFCVYCSREELSVLSNALNNIPQAVDESEYTALIGETKVKVNKILDILVASLQEK